MAASSLAEISSLVDSHTRHLNDVCAASVDTFCHTKTDGVYENPCSASSFITCTQGSSNAGTCEPGLVWESTCHCCTNPSSAVESAAGRNDEASLQQPASPFCHNKPDGMYASPGSPSDFVHCTRGAAFTLHCIRDLVWDGSCNCCNLPHSDEDASSLASTDEAQDFAVAQPLSELEPAESLQPEAPASLRPSDTSSSGEQESFSRPVTCLHSCQYQSSEQGSTIFQNLGLFSFAIGCRP